MLERIRLLDYWCCPLMRRGDIDIGWYWGSRSCLYSAHCVESIVAVCQINNYPHMQLLANKKVAQIPINKLTSLPQQDYSNWSCFFLNKHKSATNLMKSQTIWKYFIFFSFFMIFLLSLPNQIRRNENYVDTNTFGWIHRNIFADFHIELFRPHFYKLFLSLKNIRNWFIKKLLYVSWKDKQEFVNPK